MYPAFLLCGRNTSKSYKMLCAVCSQLSSFCPATIRVPVTQNLARLRLGWTITGRGRRSPHCNPCRLTIRKLWLLGKFSGHPIQHRFCRRQVAPRHTGAATTVLQTTNHKSPHKYPPITWQHPSSQILRNTPVSLPFLTQRVLHTWARARALSFENKNKKRRTFPQFGFS